MSSTRRIIASNFREAITLLNSGGVVAVPTETVYGLAADATNESAVQAIFKAKQRPAENPLIVHLANIELAQRFATIEHDWIWRCIERFSPGPISFVLPYTGGLAKSVTAGLSTVAVRIPSHPTFRELLDHSSLALAAPSANRSGRPSATTWQAVIEDLDGTIDAVICDEPCRYGVESTVIDATTETPIILRSGAISLEQVQSVAPNTKMATHASELSHRSPGTRFRHYKPQAAVHIIDNLTEIPLEQAADRCAVIGLNNDLLDVGSTYKLVEACEDVEHYARCLYDFFRRCDAARCLHIYCQSVPIVGIGRALMDRLSRASE